MNKFQVGQTVSVSADNEEWGRISEIGVVKDVRYKTLLVEVGGTIRANVLIKKSECKITED